MKKLRMILPAFAIVFAVAAAFASNATPKAFDPVDVSDTNATNCIRIGSCTPSGSEACTVSAEVPNLYIVGTCNTQYVANATFSD